MSNRKRLLIVSFTEIVNDARVKKQALLFADSCEVVTAGYGGAVRDDIHHIELDPSRPKLRKLATAACIRGKRYATAFTSEPRAKSGAIQIRSLNLLPFDAVIANELEALPLALRLVHPSRVMLDLHEFYPGLRDDLPVWTKVQKPFQEWILKARAQGVGSVTTVSDAIAARYQNEYGISAGVVRNAATYRKDLSPTPVAEPIKFVHSGVAAENRRIEVMVEAIAKAQSNVTLDLFLTQQGTEYGERLRHFISEHGGGKVTLNAPVPHEQLVPTLNQFDMGLFVLPPTNTNNSLALPNKFFDFVQARLGILIGPSPDMAHVLNQYQLGQVTQNFSVNSTISALEQITPAQVATWKRNAHKNAEELSAEAQNRVWVTALEKILGEQPRS